MLYYTHIAFAILIGIFAKDYFPVGNIILFFSILIISSLLLDIDDAGSKIGKKLGIISQLIEFFFDHRDFFHSFLFIIPVYLVLSIFTPSDVSIAFLLGSSSHLVLDSMTPAGIAAFYPFKYKVNGKIKTGSIGEKVLFGVILLIIFYKLLKF